MKNKYNLDQLFSEARQQPAKISFENITTQLNTSINGNLTEKWYSKFIHLKSIIMFSTIFITSVVFFTLTHQTVDNAPLTKEGIKKENKVKTETPSSIKKIENQDETKTVRTLSKSKNVIPIEEITITYIDSIERLIKVNYPIDDVQLTTELEENIDTSFNDSLHTIIKYTITEKTTLKELEAIEKHAKLCGIDYSYTVKHKRDNIKMLNIKMLIINPLGKKRISQFYCKGSSKSTFDYEIRWSVNSKNEVINFAGNGCSTPPNN